MNQIMINAVEWSSVQDRLDTYKRENEQLKKSLSEANSRIKILIEDVGFAERGYTGSKYDPANTYPRKTV